jgi:hypothetical protein
MNQGRYGAGWCCFNHDCPPLSAAVPFPLHSSEPESSNPLGRRILCLETLSVPGHNRRAKARAGSQMLQLPAVDAQRRAKGRRILLHSIGQYGDHELFAEIRRRIFAEVLGPNGE